VHEAPGLDDHMRGRAEMLAGLGYIALAADL
jgi:dienelactone hydrolase